MRNFARLSLFVLFAVTSVARADVICPINMSRASEADAMPCHRAEKAPAQDCSKMTCCLNAAQPRLLQPAISAPAIGGFEVLAETATAAPVPFFVQFFAPTESPPGPSRTVRGPSAPRSPPSFLA